MSVEIECVVMWRDASFFGRPGKAKRYHLPRPDSIGRYGHPVAMCDSSIPLDDESKSTIERAGILMCKRCARSAT